MPYAPCPFARGVLGAVLLFVSYGTCAVPPAPSTTGQTGLVNMPDGRLEEDGLWRFGISHYQPYSAIWTSISAFSRLEFSARFTQIDGAPTNLGANYGDYKDKSFDLKAILLPETEHLPAVAVGTQDFLGTRILPAEFLSLSKRFGEFDVTLGYGRKRIDGVFGGLRYAPSRIPDLSLVAEYDAYDYENDFEAANSGADERAGGMTYGIEYRFGWLGTQVAVQDGDWGGNVYVSVPLNRRQYVPRTEEPQAYFPEPTATRDSVYGWQAEPANMSALNRRLREHGYTDVRITLDAARRALVAELSHPRISDAGRAVGRAARILVFDGPADLEEIRIVYSDGDADLPLLTYRFSEPKQLARFFYGLISRYELAKSVYVNYARPADIAALPEPRDGALAGFGAERAPFEVTAFRKGEALKLAGAPGGGFSWNLEPLNISTFFNDPSGVLHYDLFALGEFRQQLGRGLALQGVLRATLIEDVSDVTQKSNSELPHVRSDVAEYKNASRFKLNSLLLNRYFQPAPRVYGRLSAGYYEEMFGGVGGQVLYLPRRGDWAADLSLDWVRQREFEGGFGFRDYDTVTVLGAFHYRVPEFGVTATARMGRFLARDNGVRFELKRRFGSGIEAGAWYTITDGDDTTSPGTPENPYYDKGIFLSIPLAPLLPADSRSRGAMSLAPWTRDVGQMVASPGDLYSLAERRLDWGTAELSPLSGLSD